MGKKKEMCIKEVRFEMLDWESLVGVLFGSYWSLEGMLRRLVYLK